MGKLNIMDQSGHREMQFDDPKAPNYAEVKDGEAMFNKLLAGGAKIAAKGPDGVHETIKTFDPTKEMVQIRQLVGG